VKTIATLLCFFISMSFLAQQPDRVQVLGEIVVAEGEDKEGVSIYNQSSQKGTVSDAEGDFRLEVATGDRIVITALQFQSFKRVVDESTLKKKIMKIYLNPYVNKLDEVFLSNTSLTGVLNIDARDIEVVAVPNIELSFGVDANFAPDRFSRIDGNVAEEALGYGNMTNGINVNEIFGLLQKIIFPRKENQPYVDPFREEHSLVKALQAKYDTNFYSETFEIPVERVDDFIYFAGENGVKPSMIKPENEMELLAVLFEQSVFYKATWNDAK
jgi:hypothetical protein